MVAHQCHYKLYSYFRSSCSARLRIALNIKCLAYDLEPINLLAGEQLSDAHQALNPSATVPLLVMSLPPRDDDGNNMSDGHSFSIGQSIAALEFVEEAQTQSPPPLLPSLTTPDAARTLVNIISADTQPVTNLRVLQRVRALGADVDQWSRDLTTNGLRAYEAVARKHAGRYSVGDAVTMADVCLVPAVWNAQRFGVDLASFPIVARVFEEMLRLPAVAKASYFVQPDTPEHLRKTC